VARRFVGIVDMGGKSGGPVVRLPKAEVDEGRQRLGDFIWYAAIALIGVVALLKAVRFVFSEVNAAEVGHVVLLGFFTFLRVGILIAIASLIWVPIGIYVGLRPRVASVVQPVAQFLAAFPVNLIYPIVVSSIVLGRLTPDIW